MRNSKGKVTAAGGLYRWPAILLIGGAGLIIVVAAARHLLREAAAAEPPTGGALATAASPWVEYSPAAAESSAEPASATDQAANVAGLIRRAERAGDLWNRVQRYYHARVAPIQRVLLRYRDDPGLTRRVALALLRNAHEVGIDPRVLLAVLLVENPWIDPDIRSPVGAVGLMQVMPLHRGHWPPCEADLEDIEANICHGSRIFAHYYRVENHDIEDALLRYNGCVNGTNTPNCHTYPEHVFARAGRASILAWLEPRPIRAASP